MRFYTCMMDTRKCALSRCFHLKQIRIKMGNGCIPLIIQNPYDVANLYQDKLVGTGSAVSSDIRHQDEDSVIGQNFLASTVKPKFKFCLQHSQKFAL